MDSYEPASILDPPACMEVDYSILQPSRILCALRTLYIQNQFHGCSVKINTIRSVFLIILPWLRRLQHVNPAARRSFSKETKMIAPKRGKREQEKKAKLQHSTFDRFSSIQILIPSKKSKKHTRTYTSKYAKVCIHTAREKQGHTVHTH